MAVNAMEMSHLLLNIKFKTPSSWWTTNKTQWTVRWTKTTVECMNDITKMFNEKCSMKNVSEKRIRTYGKKSRIGWFGTIYQQNLQIQSPSNLGIDLNSTINYTLALFWRMFIKSNHFWMSFFFSCFPFIHRMPNFCFYHDVMALVFTAIL